VTAAVQIQAYHRDLDLHNHTPQDTYEFINQYYFVEQVKATTAFASHLAVLIPGEEKMYLPLLRAPIVYSGLE
jgi:hypothetical protein